MSDQKRVEADGEHELGSGGRKELCTAFPRGYLPMPCPGCGRMRLEYGTDGKGIVIYIECEKCGRNSDDETLVPVDRNDNRP